MATLTNPWEIASATDVGRRRQRNEDTVFVAAPLIGICDGMGGHERGDLASQLAVEIIQHGVQQNLSLEQAMRDAGEVVFRTGRGYRGTTAVCTLLHEKWFTVSWVGDSRAYLVRGKLMEQLTQDHSDEFGRLSSCLGLTAVTPRLETRKITAQPGDVLLLCSDGLTNMVSDQQIGRVLASASSCFVIAQELVMQANAAGGIDNISVVVARRTP